MYTVSIETRFRASHQLVLPDGSKEPDHHHDWSVTADVSSQKLNNMAVVINFHKLKDMVDDIINPFHNKALNQIGCFKQNNPSAENVARYIYEKLRDKLPHNLKLERIKVVEQPGFAAKFET